MRKIFFLFVISLGFLTYTANAQSSDLTWPELKAMQKEESSALRNKQDSEFRLLVEIQKSTMQNNAGANMNDLTKLLAQERNSALKQYADERKHLAEVQAQERSAFRQRIP